MIQNKASDTLFELTPTKWDEHVSWVLLKIINSESLMCCSSPPCSEDPDPFVSDSEASDKCLLLYHKKRKLHHHYYIPRFERETWEYLWFATLSTICFSEK